MTFVRLVRQCQPVQVWSIVRTNMYSPVDCGISVRVMVFRRFLFGSYGRIKVHIVFLIYNISSVTCRFTIVLGAFNNNCCS